ncbi:MAG: hypothetical protein U0V74_04685 [Chitinophagales bacterium]
MQQPIKFTGVSTEYKGVTYNIPLPVFKAVLANGNNEYTLHLYLDTGSNGSMLFPYSVRFLYPEFLPGTTDATTELFIKQLDNNAIGFSKLFRLDHDARLSEAHENPICCGIIGTDFLKDYELHINYAISDFYLLQNEEVRLPFTCTYSFENNFLFLYAEVEGAKLKLLYDTGMGGPLLLFERGFAKLTNHNFKAVSREYANGAFGAVYYYDAYEQKMPLLFNSHLTFDAEFGVQEKHPFMDIMDCDGILGNQLFDGKQILIDYPNQKFSFS